MDRPFLKPALKLGMELLLFKYHDSLKFTIHSKSFSRRQEFKEIGRYDEVREGGFLLFEDRYDDCLSPMKRDKTI